MTPRWLGAGSAWLGAGTAWLGAGTALACDRVANGAGAAYDPPEPVPAPPPSP